MFGVHDRLPKFPEILLVHSYGTLGVHYMFPYIEYALSNVRDFDLLRKGDSFLSSSWGIDELWKVGDEMV